MRLNYVRNVSVSGCNFLGSLGGYGVAVGNESADCSVTGCLFDRVGQGGVIAYGFDRSPVPGTGSRATGNNTQPVRVNVSHNVMQDFGQTLVHVAAVAMRSASNSTASHNRVSRCPRSAEAPVECAWAHPSRQPLSAPRDSPCARPSRRASRAPRRYALQADSFYQVQNSRFNVFEFNVISDTNLLTTDTGAIEMLGSGYGSDAGNGTSPWVTGNVIRYNNISRTVESDSGDSLHVCVHAKGGGGPRGDGAGCRNLAWGVYLDGSMSGATVFGNVIGATLSGAIFDNAGGNNVHENNVLVGDASSTTLLAFGAAAATPEGKPRRAVAGSVMARNIFYFRSDAGTERTGVFPNGTGLLAYAQQARDWNDDELKPNASTRNLFFAEGFDAAAAPIFAGGLNLSAWADGERGPGRNRSADRLDASSVVADPLFVDPDAGDFSLRPGSPALTQGFVPLPPIEAPTARCGGAGARSCLRLALGAGVAPCVGRATAE